VEVLKKHVFLSWTAAVIIMLCVIQYNSQIGYSQQLGSAQYGGPGGQTGLLPPQQLPYDISTSPPQQLDGNEHYNFA